ncbi:MAG: hypothetical protein CVU46_07995 [Chloroflexi bacterium HGW-Chloroflexi-8]|nr:MAG: hypothetical protein CVU46_07995 [Chloroflexi bacterium HGW-Chloroflexi-8]
MIEHGTILILVSGFVKMTFLLYFSEQFICVSTQQIPYNKINNKIFRKEFLNACQEKSKQKQKSSDREKLVNFVYNIYRLI